MTTSVEPAVPARRRTWRPSFAPVGILAMLLAVLLFSSSSTIVKWTGTPGSALAFWRMLGATVLWWILIVMRRATTGRPVPSLQTFKAVLPVGLLFGLNIAMFFTALGRTSIAHAEFINSLSPLVLIPLGAIVFHEQPDGRALGWGALSLIGLAMVLFLGGTASGASWSGDLIVVMCVCTWAAYLMVGRRVRAHVDVVDFMATMMPLGVLTAGPIALVLAGDDLWPLPMRGWVAVGLLSVLTGMFGHALIVFAQSEVDVGTIGIIQVAQPALAIGWSFLILGESVRVAQVPGMILVVVGLGAFTIVSQRRKSRPPVMVTIDQDGELAGPAG
ncbi:MAG: DMT family transporter [Ilumatobacteraceae bacterium]